jgi:hypothetical protein
MIIVFVVVGVILFRVVEVSVIDATTTTTGRISFGARLAIALFFIDVFLFLLFLILLLLLLPSMLPC